VQHQKCSKHTKATAEELEEKIFDHAIENGVLCARGSWFRVNSQEPLEEIFFRITFASAEEDTMKVAIQRLSGAIRQAFEIEK
jgi:aromatic amino acid aminotransferase I / 2-aminoadipate transaminase